MRLTPFPPSKQKKRHTAEYDKFRLIQDKKFLSDFDKEIKAWKEKGLFGKNLFYL